MSLKQHGGKASSRRRRGVVLALATTAVLARSPAVRAADGVWDHVLETLTVKATPSAPPPAFVERTRPDPSGLGYLPPAVPHKVSPLAVKTPDQIQAQKDALDAAKDRQLDPAPVQLAKGRRGGKGKPAPAVAD